MTPVTALDLTPWHLAHHEVGDVTISTVELLNPPYIPDQFAFETLVFNADMDAIDGDRYHDKESAMRGHNHFVNLYVTRGVDA